MIFTQARTTRAQFPVDWTRALLLSAVSVLILTSAVLVVRGPAAYPGWRVYLAIVLVVTVAAGIGLFLPRYHRTLLLVTSASAFTALYAAEIVLGRIAPRELADLARVAARRAGRPFDERSVPQVLDSLRSQALIPAYPVATVAFPPGYLLSPAVVEDRGTNDWVLPLGAISHVTTVFCNESGTYSIYEADRYGFNNPDEAWDFSGVSLLIGDSYAHGACVPPASTIASRLRARGEPTVNLGIAGSAPLRQLATLKEYLPLLRPNNVIWIYFDNDLVELHYEIQNARLRRYLTREFSQNLPRRQQHIDSVLKHVTDSLYQTHLAALDQPTGDETLDVRGTLTLSRVRRLLGVPTLRRPRQQRCCNYAAFARILHEALSVTDSAEAQFLFVFMPAQERFLRANLEGAESRRQVLYIADSLGIPVLDLYPVFDQLHDTVRLWYYPGSHLTETGYDVVARVLFDRLQLLRP